MDKKALHICIFPDPVLRRASESVSVIDDQTRAFIDDLRDFMKTQPGGIGIAAPQVGVLRKIAIVDLSKKSPSAKQHILINPTITKCSKKRVIREGCMSLPDYTANVCRWNEIEAAWLDLNGKMIHYQASGLEAICIQHEIDHLEGKMFIDRVSSLKRDVFKRKTYLK